MSTDLHATCGTCRANRGELIAPGGVIYQDAWWRLEHLLEPVPMAGWLVLRPLRHVEAFAALDSDEARTFGPLVQRITQAMEEVLQPAKIYLCLFAEAESFAHIHFHLIPRQPDTPVELRGPGVFNLLAQTRQQRKSLVELATVEPVTQAIRDRLEATST